MNLRMIYLRERKRAQMLSNAEENELLRLLADPMNESQLQDLMVELWNDPEPTDPVFKEEESQRMLKNILSLSSADSADERKRFKLHSLWSAQWIKISAAVVIITLSAVLLYFNSTSDPKKMTDGSSVAPGSDKALLTLADGTQLSLMNISPSNEANYKANGIFKSSDGFVTYKPIKHQLTGNSKGTNVLTTPRGGQYKIILPDGTKVWINAASTLKFPVSFEVSNRSIELEGEAYFEVAKDKRKPFRVRSRNQVVEVYGTHFNVNSYAEEINIVTTLVEGSVGVSDLTSGEHLILKPGQQSVLAGGLSVLPDQVQGSVAWKEGYFLFEHEELSSIMRKLSRWYDINVEIPDEELKSLRFAGTVNRFENLEDVLRMLELTGDVKFRTNGRIVTAFK